MKRAGNAPNGLTMFILSNFMAAHGLIVARISLAQGLKRDANRSTSSQEIIVVRSDEAVS
ncbi:MAG: hypothetical protein AAGD92_13615 [Pseudomonadota bacterium]